jgi:hypothetical protein
MSALIDSTLEELDRQVRQLKRELTALEGVRRQLSPTAADPPATQRAARTR